MRSYSSLNGDQVVGHTIVILVGSCALQLHAQSDQNRMADARTKLQDHLKQFWVACRSQLEERKETNDDSGNPFVLVANSFLQEVGLARRGLLEHHLILIIFITFFLDERLIPAPCPRT